MLRGRRHRFLGSVFFSHLAISLMAVSMMSEPSCHAVQGLAPPPAPAASNTAAAVKRTFYKRALPVSCIALSSKEGQARFASALAGHGLKNFFSLIEQFTTQSEPAYCGISTLVMVLNALALDPRKIWKGPWRWYEESMLNCCVDLEQVKSTGITIRNFQCLAMCQGVSADCTYAEDAGVDQFRQAVQKACVSWENENDNEPQEILVVSYSRKILGQTGSGHFSPIAAYDAASDSVLVLDTARFKYGPHWVPLPLMFEATIPQDPDAGRSRGYLLLRAPDEDKDDGKRDSQMNFLSSVLLRTKQSQREERKKYKLFLAQHSPEEITWDMVVQYLTQNGTKANYIWNIVEPQLTPLEEEADEMGLVESLRTQIDALIAQVSDQDFPAVCCECRNNRNRTLCLHPKEATLLIYLASLDEANRKRIILSSTIGDGNKPSNQLDDDTVQAQLLAEAELLRYAIDMSDEI